MTRYSTTLLLLLLAPLSASAFTTVPQSSTRTPTAVFMSEKVDSVAQLVLTGNNIDLTPALEEYAQKRIGGLLDKLGSGGIVRECDVHLSVSKNPAVRIRQNKCDKMFIVTKKCLCAFFFSSSI